MASRYKKDDAFRFWASSDGAALPLASPQGPKPSSISLASPQGPLPISKSAPFSKSERGREVIKLLRNPGYREEYMQLYNETSRSIEKDIHDETEKLKKDLAEHYKHHEGSSSKQVKSDLAEHYKYYKGIELPVPQGWQNELDRAKHLGWI